jgi:two-component system OmpR family response regulator
MRAADVGRVLGPAVANTSSKSTSRAVRMPILLIEDNVRLTASLVRGFGECDLVLESVATGSAALERLTKQDCDAVVLDLGLPDIDGLEVLSSARQMGVLAPVLVLSARDAVEQRVAALDRGADDYLIKPFVFAELVARVRALVRRASAPRWAPLRLGDLRVDADSPHAWIGARSIALSPREHALLQHLVRHAGQVADRRGILSAVFGYEFDPGTNVIDVHVAHLRRKLEGTNVRLETVRGQGYRVRVPAAVSGSDTDG